MLKLSNVITMHAHSVSITIYLKVDPLSVNINEGEICDWAKPAMFAHKLKFILLAQLIATLNNYAYSLPPLANVNWSAFPECFMPNM